MIDKSVIIRSQGASSGYRVLIIKHKFKCVTCGKIYEVIEETLFSRKDNEDKSPDTGYLTLSNIDGNCPNSILMIHEKSTSIPISNGNDNFVVNYEIRTFKNKESWLHHLKFFYKIGFCIEFRNGKIGREELQGEDLKDMAYDDMSDELNFSDEEILRAFGRRPREGERVSILLDKTTMRIIPSLHSCGFVLLDQCSISQDNKSNKHGILNNERTTHESSAEKSTYKISRRDMSAHGSISEISTERIKSMVEDLKRVVPNVVLLHQDKSVKSSEPLSDLQVADFTTNFGLPGPVLWIRVNKNQEPIDGIKKESNQSNDSDAHR